MACGCSSTPKPSVKGSEQLGMQASYQRKWQFTGTTTHNVAYDSSKQWGFRIFDTLDTLLKLLWTRCATLRQNRSD